MDPITRHINETIKREVERQLSIILRVNSNGEDINVDELLRRRDLEWLSSLGFVPPYRRGFGPKEAAEFLKEARQNEVAEAEQHWPKACECDHPIPTHGTSEADFAWCQCGGYVRVTE